MKTSIIVILSGVVLFSSCRRTEEVLPIPQPPEPVSILNIGDTIEYGLPDNMVITSDTIVMQGTPSGEFVHGIDADADGIVDVEIRLNASVSLGAGFQAFSRVTPMHALATIRAFQRSDTSFLSNDTITTTINRTVSCSRLSPWDDIISITPNATKVLWFEGGDLFTATDDHYSEEVTLRRTNGQAPIQTFEPPYAISSFTKRDCFLLPLDQVVYIGLAVLDGAGGQRLGWVKLDHELQNKIVIYEHAIQAP